MLLSENNLQQFAIAVLDTFDLREFSIDKEKALGEVKNDILAEYKDLNLDETKKARNKNFKVKHACADDYTEKILILNAEKKVIYGIRHKGGNAALPFIQITTNFKIKSRTEVIKIYAKIKLQFAVFRPLYICFWSQARCDEDFLGSIYMLSTVDKFKLTTAWPNESKLKLTQISDDTYYEWYIKGYNEFHLTSPELKTKVTVNSMDSMKNSLNQGLLYYIELDNERIGLISAEKNNFLGQPGIYFHEIFISKQWKGMGLAKAIQRKFVTSFTEAGQFVWGTIDWHNLPSYKTAYANGRKAIRYECFIDLSLGGTGDL